MGEVYRFRDFRLDADRRVLQRNGEMVPLAPKVVETLLVLVRRAGEVVDKETLFAEVWPAIHVVESSLARNISVLRKALDSGEGESLIQTASKRGYRFQAPVTIEKEEPAERAEAAVPARRKMLVAAATAGIVAIAAAVSGILRSRGADPPGIPLLAEEYRQYLIGRHLWTQFAPEELEKALAHFERAAQRNPRLALAYAGIADTYVVMAALGLRPVETSYAEAKRAAERSVQLDPRLAVGRTSLAISRMVVDWDWRGAEEEGKRAIALEPQSARPHYGVALIRLNQGRFDEARSAIRTAQSIDPVAPQIALAAARIEYASRNFGRAAAMLKELLDHEPRFSLAHYFLALSLGYLGDTDGALEALDDSRVSAGLKESDRAWLLAQKGDLSAARSLWVGHEAAVNSGKAPRSNLLLLAVTLGRTEDALAAVEDLVERRRPESLALKIDPRLAPLRAEPRFQDALKKVGLI